MRWYIAESDDDGMWRPAGATREEAIAQAATDFGLEPFYIASSPDVHPFEVFPSATDFLQSVQEHVLDEYGQEDWPELSTEEGSAFAAEYQALIKKYFPEVCPFGSLSGAERIVPGETHDGIGGGLSPLAGEGRGGE